MAPSTSVIPSDEQLHYEVFRDCVSEPVLRVLAAPPARAPKKRRREKKQNKKASKTGDVEFRKVKLDSSNDEASIADDLADFIDYLSTDMFAALPTSLRTLTHPLYTRTAALQSTYALPLAPSTVASLAAVIPVSTLDSLFTYGLRPSASAADLPPFLTPILSAYISTQITPPPPWSATRTSECELCERSWIPTTYHHLIPRSMHAKVLKRGWHPEDQLGSVAWLCRACHSFVHRIETNEELARNWYTVELLKGREDVERWVEWVGRVRWKKR